MVAWVATSSAPAGDSDEELRLAYDWLAAAGVTFVETSDPTSAHILAPTRPHPGPDGSRIELHIDLAGVHWKSDPSQMMAPFRPVTR